MKKQKTKIMLAGFILVMIGVALPLFGFGLPTPLAVAANPTVRIVDVQGSPISGAYIFLFEGGGGVTDWSEADAMQITDFDGRAEFVETGFYRVGVIKNGYVAADAVHTPPAEWQTVYSAWGAGGLRANLVYTITLEYTGIDIQEPTEPEPTTPEPTIPEPTEPTPIPLEPQTVAYSALNYVTFAGVGLIVAGAVLGRKHK